MNEEKATQRDSQAELQAKPPMVSAEYESSIPSQDAGRVGASTSQVRSSQGDCHREHADHAQAEESIESNLPAQGFHQPDYEHTEDEEHAQVEQLPFGFGEPDQLLPDPLHGRPDHQATDEGGDEAVTPDLVGQRPGDDRQHQEGKPLGRVRHPPSLRSPPHEPAPCQADADADESAEAYLLQGETYPEVRGQALRFHRQDQEQRQEGHREAVVEPGLDVQGLAYAGRDARVAHHRLPKRGVGRGEHRPYDRRLPEGEIGELQRRSGGTQRYGQRHPDTKKAQGQSLVLS